MKKFVIRNYGKSRILPFQGQNISVGSDGVIETDDVEMANALSQFPQVCVTERPNPDGVPAPGASLEKPEKGKDDDDQGEDNDDQGEDKTRLGEGDRVSAVIDGETYEGEIQNVDGEKVTVKFDDDDVEIVDLDELTKLEKESVDYDNMLKRDLLPIAEKIAKEKSLEFPGELTRAELIVWLKEQK